MVVIIIILLILIIISLMSHETGASPKHVFMYLLLIAMLYVSVVSFIAIIFQYINVLLPDPLQYYLPGIYDTIRFASSSLVVAFPVYLLMSWLLEKEYIRVPEAKQLKSRKWLVYLTLFIAAITIIVDLVQLVNNFYRGELTWSFTLKIMTVLIVAATVFGYHLWDLQKDLESKVKKMIGGIISVVVLATLIAGFFIAGSPQHQRNVRFDQQRTTDLNTIQYQILDYWQRKKTLPAQLSDLEDSITGFQVPKDPATGTAYTYEIKGNLSFTLCADFAAEQEGGKGDSRNIAPMYPMNEFGANDNWSHKAGRTCFDRTIDPERHALPQQKI